MVDRMPDIRQLIFREDGDIILRAVVGQFPDLYFLIMVLRLLVLLDDDGHILLRVGVREKLVVLEEFPELMVLVLPGRQWQGKAMEWR